MHVCVCDSCAIRLEEIQMFSRKPMHHHEHVWIQLAQLHWSKSLWEAFTADFDLFREYQSSGTVSLCVRSHT